MTDEPQYFTLKKSVTREDLHAIGICSKETFDVLLSGAVFKIKERRLQRSSDRTMLFIDRRDMYLWVWEDMVDYIEDIHVYIHEKRGIDSLNITVKVEDQNEKK